MNLNLDDTRLVSDLKDSLLKRQELQEWVKSRERHYKREWDRLLGEPIYNGLRRTLRAALTKLEAERTRLLLEIQANQYVIDMIDRFVEEKK